MSTGRVDRRPWWFGAVPADLDTAARCCVCGAIVDCLPGVPGLPPEPMCDACTRAREFDQTLWELDLAEPDAGLW